MPQIHKTHISHLILISRLRPPPSPNRTTRTSYDTTNNRLTNPTNTNESNPTNERTNRIETFIYFLRSPEMLTLYGPSCKMLSCCPRSLYYHLYRLRGLLTFHAHVLTFFFLRSRFPCLFTLTLTRYAHECFYLYNAYFYDRPHVFVDEFMIFSDDIECMELGVSGIQLIFDPVLQATCN